MAKPKTKTGSRAKAGMAQPYLPEEMARQVGVISQLTDRKQHEVWKAVAGPAIEAEYHRVLKDATDQIAASKRGA